MTQNPILSEREALFRQIEAKVGYALPKSQTLDIYDAIKAVAPAEPVAWTTPEILAAVSRPNAKGCHNMWPSPGTKDHVALYATSPVTPERIAEIIMTNVGAARRPQDIAAAAAQIVAAFSSPSPVTGALEKALPFLEMLHTLVNGREARAIVFKVIRETRDALSTAALAAQKAEG